MEGLTEDVAKLLADLAQESRETVEELLSRLIQKEHFSRHCDYNALSGKTTPKQCMSRECFMKKRVSS
jgi:predicted transcriptional regulator